MTDLKRVAYCGLYCGLCLNCVRIPRRAGELKELLKKVSAEEWGPELPGFDGFWRFLDTLAEFEPRASCREQTCGPEPCAIRTCASAKGVTACPFCDEYPCDPIHAIAKRYVTLLGDGQRMRDIGLDRWIEEQEARQARGFAYTDIGHGPAKAAER